MASYLDTINKLYEIERKRIDPYSSAKKVEAQQTSVVPQLQTSSKSEAASGEKNVGDLLGGLGYLGEKLAVGLMQSVEGIWDFTAGGIADLLGADAWAEEQIATDWFGDWYETAGDWFNAGDGWKTAGDVASGIGTSVIPMAAAMFIPVPGANAALAGLTRFGVSTLAATPSAGGSALREAYKKTGKVDENTWGYALQSGMTEGALEGVTNVIGIGGGALLKQFGKTAAKNMAKQATKAAANQGMKATLSSIGKTAFEGFIGEAFEEGVSTILNPIYARATYDPEAQNATAQEIAYSAWVGGLAGAVMGEGGLIASSALSAKSGGTLVAKNYQNDVLSFADTLIEEESKNPTDSAAMKIVNAKKAQLEKSLQDNNGVWGMTQKKLLGDLNAAETEVVMEKAVVASALNLINNADAIATELSAYGYTDSNGNPIKITAEQIRAGISGKTKNIAIRKALENNPLLRSLASADAAGRLLMDTDSFAEQARSGKTFRTQDLLDQFIERASDEQKASLGHDLGINNWDGLRVEEFNYLVDNQYDTVGKQFKRARQKQRFEKLRGNKSIAVGKASAYRAKNDGIRKYKVNGHTFAVEKSGDEYTLYDYDNKGVSIELSIDELRKSLKIYDDAQAKLKQSAEKTSDTSEQGAEHSKSPTAEKSHENARKEKTVTEKDTGESDNNVQKSFKIAKKVAWYDKLSAPDQRRVRSFIRQGLAFGVKEDIIVAGASISARTHTEAIFNKDMCAVRNEDGSITYANAFYDPHGKRFVFNPDVQSTDGFIIHELDHAIRKRVGKGGFVTTKIYKGAIEKLNPDTFKKITEKYDKKHEQRGKVPETVTYLRRTSEQKLVDKLVEQKNQEEFAKTAETLIDEYEAHYAQQVLENKGITEHLVAERPALKQRILDFFKGAEVDYAKVPALSKEAAKYYKMYKRWFDSFAKSREGARIGAEAEMGVRVGESDVRYSFIGRTNDGRGIYKTNYPANTSKTVKQQDIVNLVQNVWSEKPIKLSMIENGKATTIEARFNPELSERSDLSKITLGNRKGTNSEKRITLNLSSDLYQIAEESTYVGSKAEIGKSDNPAHYNVSSWHYFVTNLVYVEEDGTQIDCYMNIDVKQNDEGHWFYSFAIEKGTAPRTLLAVVTDEASATVPTDIVHETKGKVNPSDEKTAKNSQKDSEGHKLTKEQAEYFKDSKVRDKDGNLRAMYQGAQEEFTVFDRKKSKPSNLYGRGFYFTDSESQAALYGAYRQFYLDIKNPVSTNDKTITRMQMRKFLNAVAKNEDYSIENYGTTDIGEILASVYSGKSDFLMIQDVSSTAIGDLVQAIELFNDVNGTRYDGFILDTETVTFRSNQAKLTSNKAPTSNPDIRMSLPIGNEDVSVEVEEKGDLLAIHNLTEQNLLDTLNLGGFPMPSIAVVRKGQEHSKYGDISVVFGRETIDPRTSPYNKIYGSDAWTPTYPRIEYKANAKVAKKISDKYYDLQSKYGYDSVRAMYQYAHEIEDRLNGRKGEANLIKELYDDTRMMQIYLMDIGKGRVETVTKEIRTEMTEIEKRMNDFFVKELGENFINSFIPTNGEPIFSYRIEFVKKNEQKIKDAFKKYLVDVLGIEPDLVGNVIDAQRTSDYAKMIRDAYRYIHEGAVSVKTEDDLKATEEAIRKAADNEQYREWVDSLFKGVQEKSGIRNSRDYYDKYGNSRSWEQLHYENTIDNVIRVMREDVETGGNTLFSGNSIWGVAAKEYKSIDDVKADKERLKTLPEEEYKNLSGELGGRLSAIAETIKSDSESNPFIATDNALQLIVDCVRTCKTKPAMLKYLKHYSAKATIKTVDDIVDLVHDIANMPTGYFEAKPRRAVNFSEIKMVELPESASDTLKDKLADRKIPFEIYGSTDMERFNAIQRLPDVSFSLPLTDADGNTIEYSEEDLEYARAVQEGMARNDMSEVQDMVDEKARKAGYTVKGLHATNAEFTVFDINKTSSENFHGKGIYFTNSVRDVENNYENYEGPDPWQKIEGRAYELAYDKYGISYEDTLTSDSEIIDKLNECYDIAIDEFKKSGRRITAYLRFDNPLILEKGMQIPYDYAGYDGIVDKQVYENIGHSGMDENTIHYVVFNPNNIKSADPVTYDDNGYIIPLSKRFDPTMSDIRFSMDLDGNGDGSVDIYTDEQYNSFGWARHAEALTKDELDDLYSKLQEKKILRRFKQSSSGEAIVEVNDKPKTTLGVDNVFVFVKGKATEPQITRLLRVSLFNETDMEKVRKFIYDNEKRANARTSIATGNFFFEEGLFTGFARNDFPSYQAYRSEIGKRSVRSQSERDSSYDRSRYERDRYTRRSEDDVSYSLPLDDSYVDKSVPYVGEDNMSVGEMRKRIANSTHYKVYSKSRVLNTIKSLTVIDSLNGKTVETLADAMWKSFNAITSTEQAESYVSDMADYIMSVAMSDAKTKRNIPEDSQRRFNMMRGYVQKLVFTEKELDEIKTVRGEKELKRILGRWGYKAKNDANGMKSIKTPVDVFVTDIAREMSEFSYIEDMNPIDAFFALDEAYTEAKNDVSDKWQSIFEDVSDEDIDSIRYALKDDLMNAFKNAGDKSNYKKILENTVERYKDRADYWKAEYDKENGRSRLTNIVAAKARKLKDLKVHRFANATQFENDTLDAVIAKLARVVINGNLSVKTAKSACGELLMLYRSSTFREGVLEFYDENNQGYYNELIETYLEILVGEENHLSIEDYVEKGDQYYKGYTKQQLKMLADVMSYFTSLYENYGKVWKNGKLEEAMPLAKQYITGIRETKAIYGERIGNRLTNWYRDTFFDPISVMRRIDGYDDGFFTDIYGEFRRGVIDAEIAKMNIFREYDGWLNSHKKYLANASETAVEFMGHKIPKIKLVDLYCTSKRKQAQAGLAINGFAYDDLKGLVVRVDGKLDKDGKYTEEQIQEVITDMQTEIEKHLTAEDREYISLIEKVYNGEAKRLKTMRDFARQGFTNAEADYYYPIRRAYIKKSVDSATMKEEIDRVSNASFNKDVVKGAKQELTVESADSRFRRHVQAVCQYAYLSPAIDTFNRLYNLDTIGNKDRSVSIRNESENLWRKGMMYFEKLVSDIQGINERTEGSEVLSFIRGGYAISVLSVNPKVWVTQLSSFAAASGMIDNDCLIKGVRTATKEDVENIGRYCPLAELRRYDNTAAMAQAVVDNRGVQRGSGSKAVQAMRKLGEAGMKPIEKVDSMVINRLFGACMQQVEKYQGIKIGTEENKIAAGKLLETLILETQQNALATERSAAMRSNNEIFRAATMFSADAMKVVGRFVDATGEARALKARIKNAADAETKTALESRLNEAHKKVRKSLGALIASSAYMAGVTALFKLLYNKWDKEWEEDESKANSVISSITLDFIGNNFGGLPLIRDVISKLTEGYDIDNYAYSAINDIVQAAQNLANLASSDTSSEDVSNALKNLVYATSSFTGLPARNVYNVVYGLTKRVSEPAAYKIDELFYKKNYASDLQKYIDEGDVTMSDFIIDLIYDTRVGDTVKESTMKKIRSLANKGYKVIPREIKATVTVDGNEYTLTEKEQEDVREKYFDYLSALDSLCEGAMYSSLDEEKKYQAIKNVIDIGYEKALSDIIGTECSRGTLLSYCIGVESFAALKSVVKDYENDVDKKGNVIEGSKREKVVKAIRSMPATATQKVLMMYALGYTPKDNEVGGMTTENAKKRLLSSIVNATDLTKAQKEQLAAACGFTVKNGKIVP